MKFHWMLVVGLVFLAGCGSSHKTVSVSGIVLIDGQATPDVNVSFVPQPNAETSIVGPTSFGTTDAEGKFTLQTRDGDSGAIVGTHKVSCQFKNFDPVPIEVLTSKIAIANKKDKEDPEVQEELEELQIRLAKEKQRNWIPEKYNRRTELSVIVPASGLSDYKIELESDVIVIPKKESSEKESK